MLVKPEKTFHFKSLITGNDSSGYNPILKYSRSKKLQDTRKTEKANLTPTLSDGLYENHRP